MEEQAQHLEPADHTGGGGHDRTSPDMSGLGRPGPDMSDHVTAKEAQAILFNHGLPRNDRSIRRYCQRGDLQCIKVDTSDGGRQYVVNSKSIEMFVAQQQQIIDTSRRTSPDLSGLVRTGPDMSEPIVRETPPPHDREELLALLRDQLQDAKEQVRKKDEQIDRKDNQIAAMLERDHEINILIQNLQGMMRQLNAPKHPPYDDERTAADTVRE